MRLTELRRCDRGTQLAELALVLPLMLFISLGIIEGSSFIRVHQIINNAAREGARLSSLPENAPSNQVPDPTPQIKDAVIAYAQNNGITLSQADVMIDQNKLITTSGGTPYKASQVVVSYNYDLQYLFKLPWFTQTKTVPLKATAEFVNFY